MGLPERLIARQMRSYKGTAHEKMRTARRANNVGLLAAGLNGLAVLFGLLGNKGSLQSLWVVLGALWLVLAYLLLQQRLYLKRLDAQR